MTANDPLGDKGWHAQLDRWMTVPGDAAETVRKAVSDLVGESFTSREALYLRDLKVSVLWTDSPIEPAGLQPVSSTVLRADNMRIAVVIWGSPLKGTETILAALGFGNCCKTSAETVASCYLAWKEQFVFHLDRSCSIVLWDERENRLVLVNQPALA